MWRSVLKGDRWWINFVMMLGAGIFFLTLSAISYLRHSQAMVIPYLVFGCSPIAGAFLGLRYRIRKYGDGPTSDEREASIGARAGNLAGLVLLCAWVLVFGYGRYIAEPEKSNTMSIKSSDAAAICLYGMLLYFVVRLVAMRVIRSRELSHGKD